MLFHAGFAPFAGGFVGVDVFFVISGYLITGIILNELEQGSFSLAGFYERRARRILPALFLVILCCLPFAWMWLTPQALTDFGESVAAVAVFASNILFWLESGYFDTAAEMKPLLHTWSLAVEEQYYIFFPLLLMAMWRWGKRRLLVLLAAGFAVSLGLAQWGAYNKPDATFYLLPTRGWELLIGAFVAFHFHARRDSPVHSLSGVGLLSQAGSLIGLGLIAVAVFGFDSQTPFPSLYALVPTVGTALIILLARPGTLANWLLSCRPVVGLGLLSYSAYLWHQPLFSFARYRSTSEPGAAVMLGLCLVAIGLAYLSWRFVEVPFRRRTFLGRWQILSLSGFALIAFFAVGMAGRANNGWESRLPPEVASLLGIRALHDRQRDDGGCNRYQQETHVSACQRGADVPATYALVGDSHATAIAQELASAFADRGLSYIQYTKNVCPLAETIAESNRTRCAAFLKNALADIEARGIDTIIVMARWSYYLHEDDYRNGEGGVERRGSFIYTAEGVPFSAPLADRKAAILRDYAASLDRLVAAGKRIIVVGPVPEPGWDVPLEIVKRRWLDPDAGPLPSIPVRIYEARHADVLRVFAPLRSNPAVVFVDPLAVFCDASCPVEIDGEPLYYDDDHLSNHGAAMLVREMMRHVR